MKITTKSAETMGKVFDKNGSAMGVPYMLTYLELSRQPRNPRKLGAEALPSSNARPNTWSINCCECNALYTLHLKTGTYLPVSTSV